MIRHRIPRTVLQTCRHCGQTRHTLNGAWLRERRERAGLGLRELARRAGISASFLSDVERGTRFLNDVERGTRHATPRADAAYRSLSRAVTPAAGAGTVRVLPADVYDTLELVALAYGGVGCGRATRAGVPWSSLGLALAAAPSADRWITEVPRTLLDAGITARESDAVFRPDERRRRIPFAEWCRRLHVVRGPHPEADA